MANKPKLNVPLLKRTLKHLREEPKRYYQSQWGRQVDPTTNSDAPACGTQGCIAGWAVLLSIPQNLWESLFKGDAFEGGIYGIGGGMSCSPVTYAAQDLLGVTEDEAVALFHSTNQTYTRGEKGVEEAAAKINLLIRDRAAFVRKYR